MAEIQAAMMWMVLFLAFDVFHRIRARHGLARGAVNRPEVGLVGLIDDVFGKDLAVHLHDSASSGGFFDSEFSSAGQ
jgi:hypothetical protein